MDFKNGFGFAVKNLTVSLQTLLNNHAPLKTKSISVVDHAPWFDKEYRELRKLRRNAERKKNRSSDNLIYYKDLCAKATKMAHSKKKAFITNTINKSKCKSRTLYKMVNNILDRKQTAPLPDNQDLLSLAKNFNEFFIDKIDKLRSNMETSITPNITQSNVTPLFDFYPTCIDEIREIINKSGVKCSPADMLPTMLMKKNLESLLPTIVTLVNLSLSSASMDGVKVADIIPSIKDVSLDPNILNYFRPVSNLVFLGKLIEQVVQLRLEEHMSLNNLNCPEQSAYRKNHSTETLLIKMTNDLLIASDEQTATVVMLLDLSAAFDTVDHTLLLKILHDEIGIKGTALAWFASFLQDRSQRIRLGDITSDTITIKFGVPQGSVLGPILFNIYIRSIYLYVKKLGFKINGYADDHQISKSFVPSDQLEVLTINLINCFSEIKRWMIQYYLHLNGPKTQIIVFGPRSI